MKTKHMTTLHLRNSIGRSPLRLGLPRVQPTWIIRGFLLIPLALACLALPLTARAVSPAPDGGYPNDNTADGYGALNVNTTSYGNVATGAGSLIKNTTGHLNIAVGPAAGQNQTTGSNNIDIANAGVAGEANTIRIGNQVAFTDVVGIAHPAQTKAFIAGISGSAVTGLTVVANSTGQIGVITSSRRFKDDIKPMDKASEAILALKPVTFRYKPEIDSQGIPQFGLVAEEVEKVNPDLVVRDEKGEI